MARWLVNKDTMSMPVPALKALKMLAARDVTPVVLLDMGVPGLTIARALGRRHIPVIALDTKPDHWTHCTRYAMVLTSSRFSAEDNLMRILDAVADAFDKKPVLIPLHDDYVRFVSRNRIVLGKKFLFALPLHEVVEALTDKRGLYRLCEANRISVPKTVFPASLEELEAQAEGLTYPVIFKPAHSRRWQSERAQTMLQGQKAVQVNSVQELLAWYRRLREIDLELLVQEIIPGKDANLYYVVSYVGRNGQHCGFFMGRKLRTFPIHFGQGSYVQSTHEPKLVELASRVIAMLDYHGNIGIEFKYDERDGLYKLIEINARFGLWDGFSADCGLDLIYALYKELTEERLPPGNSYQDDRYWLDFDRDFWALVQYRRVGELSIREWLKTIARPHISPIYVRDDLRPAVAYAGTFIGVLARRASSYFLRRLVGVSGH